MVAGVTVAVAGDEHSRVELLGERLRPLQRGGRVAGGADDDDRGGPVAWSGCPAMPLWTGQLAQAAQPVGEDPAERR